MIFMENDAERIAEIFSTNHQIEAKADEPRIKVNRSLSRATTVYERLRNVIDYQDESLFLKNSIKRILKRRTTLGETRNLGAKLLRELVWGGYFADDALPESLIEQVNTIFRKYNYWRSSIISIRLKPKQISNYLLGLMACEIEELLSPRTKQYAFLEFATKTYLNQVDLEDKSEIEEENLLELIRISIEQSILKSDIEQTRYRILKSRMDNWQEIKKHQVKDLGIKFDSLHKNIEDVFDHPRREKVFRFVRKNAAPFLALYDLLTSSPQTARLALADENYLKEKVEAYASKKYKDTKVKVLRASSRAIAFLFLTKVMLAIFIEVPYEMAFADAIDYRALSINILLPPALMLIASLLIKIPGEANTQKIFANIKTILSEQRLLTRKLIYLKQRKTNAYIVYDTVYTVLSLGVLGLVVWLLINLKFNIVSISLFFIFVSVVSFLAFRIRSTASELRVDAEDENLVSGAIEIIFLPFIRIGHWLTFKFSQYNFTLFFWDFIVEAPLKAIVSALESWFLFIREKKEQFE